MQCVIEYKKINETVLNKINTGAAISIYGKLIESQGEGQKFEIKVDELKIIGESDPNNYPIQSKKHSLEFLREKQNYVKWLAPRLSSLFIERTKQEVKQDTTLKVQWKDTPDLIEVSAEDVSTPTDKN